MKSDTIDFFLLYLVRTIKNLFRTCFNNDFGLQDLIDLFSLHEIPYGCQLESVIGPEYLRSRQQD